MALPTKFCIQESVGDILRIPIGLNRYRCPLFQRLEAKSQNNVGNISLQVVKRFGNLLLILFVLDTSHFSLPVHTCTSKPKNHVNVRGPLNRRCRGPIMPILIQINIEGE